MAAKRIAATVYFIESMEYLTVIELPDGPPWTDDLKLDKFRVRR